MKAQGLRKVYRGRAVVDGVDLFLKQGEVVGLLGPNGAGKTTSFYMTIGLVQPTSGEVFFRGQHVTNMPMYRRARLGMGYLAQEPSIFRKLSVADNIMAILETRPGLSTAHRQRRLETLMADLHITSIRESRGDSLSG